MLPFAATACSCNRLARSAAPVWPLVSAYTTELALATYAAVHTVRCAMSTSAGFGPVQFSA